MDRLFHKDERNEILCTFFLLLPMKRRFSGKTTQAVKQDFHTSEIQ
jgi:hypothetical protein